MGRIFFLLLLFSFPFIISGFLDSWVERVVPLKRGTAFFF